MAYSPSLSTPYSRRNGFSGTGSAALNAGSSSSEGMVTVLPLATSSSSSSLYSRMARKFSPVPVNHSASRQRLSRWSGPTPRALWSQPSALP